MPGERLSICLHYGRAARGPSGGSRPKAADRDVASRTTPGAPGLDSETRGVTRLFQVVLLLVIACALAPSAPAQYPGQIKIDKNKDQPALRAIAVLEWTGDLSKPKTSRLVPITVFDGEQLQDAGVYMARPAPLAVMGGVEYILQKGGSKLGLFDVMNAGQEQGSWVGFGTWKPMPKPKPVAAPQKIDEDVSDRPVLHRKHGSGGSDSKASGGAQGPPPDPDRPTLHKKSADDSGAGDSGKSGKTDSGQANSAPASDPDRPTLHKTPDTSANSGQTSKQTSGQGSDSGGGTVSSTTSSDPDRPALKRGKAKQEPDQGYVSSVQTIDPNRPKLARGKTSDNGPDITPTLVGLPSGMEQAVAVSDPRNHADHPWNYTWADPADELKMKAALEDAARAALGLPAAPPALPAVKRTSTTTKTKAKTAHKSELAPEPAPLVDEQFRVFELSYGSGATLVLTAHTDGPPEKQKYVTLIGQPDLYGKLRVLFQSVADGAHLDDTPRMRLVDAVDVLADNRGELLFELRGATQRQFALYRVLRGSAKQLFVTGGGATSID